MKFGSEMVSEQSSEKVLILVDGVGALGFMPIAMGIAVRLNRLPFEVKNYVWTHGYGRMLADLRDKNHIETKGEELAGLISDLIEQKRQILVVAKSGGTAVALNALSRLKPDSIAQGVLLSPAVSPQYDLEQPLKAIKGKLYCFNSKYDLFWLGLLTSMFGTPDGVKTKAAGCVGFHRAADYEKLREIVWIPEMMQTFHFGEHSGTSSLPFLMKYVLPLLDCEKEFSISGVVPVASDR